MNAQLMTQQNNSIMQIAPQSDVPVPMFGIRKTDGYFTCSIGLEYPINEASPEFKHMRVAVIQVVMKRSLWPVPFSDGDAPLCKSDDMVNPVNRMGEYGATNADGLRTCVGCKLAEWETDKKGKRIKPACSEDYVVLLVDLETGVPGILPLRRTRVAAGKQLMGFSRFMGQTYAALIWTVAEGNGSLQWYGLRSKAGGEFTDADRAKVAKAGQMLSNMVMPADDHDGTNYQEPVELSEEARTELMLRD
jgi:hypothetical protein